jgi:ectoine hydroxylase-related dioxygenase (phytanoyl-CoA dioxygenase family)
MSVALPAGTRRAFEETGYAVVASFAPAAAIEEVRLLLDPLFERFQSLPAKHAIDLGPTAHGKPRIPDINRAISIEPRLRKTDLYRRAHLLARALVGSPAFYTFDHAIYKPPHNLAATPWHQDQAYTGLSRPLTAVHIWIPLQPATKENGCMWFVPGTHRAGSLRHAKVEGTTTTLEAYGVDESLAVCCPLPIGGATAHTPMTLHMTGPNTSDSPRRAWVLHFARYGRLGILHPVNVRDRLRRLARDVLVRGSR